MISTAGDAALSVDRPGPPDERGVLVAAAAAGGFSESAWTAPVSNDAVTITFKQAIEANDALRTGSVRQDADVHVVDHVSLMDDAPADDRQPDGMSGRSRRARRPGRGQAGEVGAHPRADAPGHALFAGREGGRERVARQRLVRGQRLVRDDRVLRRTVAAQLRGGEPEPRVGVRHRPVAAERQHGAGVEQVAHPERARGPLGPEPLAPVALRA